jgi:hypothetical protein
MQGFNVLHPMGWDAFGLPAEQHAIKTGTHPAVETDKNIARFKQQLNSLGFQLRLGSRDQARPSPATTVDAVDLQQALRARARLYQRGSGLVVRCSGHRARQRGGHQRPQRTRRPPVREAPDAPVDAQDHRIRRSPARRPRRTSTGPSQSRRCSASGSAAAKGARVEFARGRHEGELECGCSRPARHALRRDLSWCSRPSTRSSTRSRQPSSGGGRRVSREASAKSELDRTELHKDKTGGSPGRTPEPDLPQGTGAEDDRARIPDLDRGLRARSATAPARSWPCPAATSATSTSPSTLRSSRCRRSSSAPTPAAESTIVRAGAKRPGRTASSATVPCNSENSELSSTGLRAGRQAKTIDWLVQARLGEAHGPVPPARLALLAPALLGRALPGPAPRGRQSIVSCPRTDLPSRCR